MKKVYLIAVVFALIAGFATFMFARQLDAKTTIQDEDMVDVYVATVDVPADTVITEDMFTNEDAPTFVIKQVINDGSEENSAKTQEELIDKVVKENIYQGEQITLNRVVDKDDDSVGLSLKLNPGMVAYSFSAGSVSGVDGYIIPGDTVDVIVYEKDASGKTVTSVAYEDLKIIRVSTASENQSASSSGATITSYSTLTVEVTEKQALQLYKIENDYSFKLVLNPRTVDKK